MGTTCSSLMRKVPGRNTSGLGKRQKKPAGDPEQREIHDHRNPLSTEVGPQISTCKLDSARGPLTGLVGLLLQPVGVRVFRPSSASHLTRGVTRYEVVSCSLLKQGCLGPAVFDVAQGTQARTVTAGPTSNVGVVRFLRLNSKCPFHLPFSINARGEIARAVVTSDGSRLSNVWRRLNDRLC
jgi:hypothetical protein